MVLAVAALVGSLSGMPACPNGPRLLPAPTRGVVLALHDADPRRSYRGDVLALAELGVNAISVMPTWHMADVRDGAVRPGNSTAAQLEEALATAEESNIAVLVAPVIQVEHLAGEEWRGVLAPPDWDRWFEHYRRLLLDAARLAERHRAEALLIGSELCSTERFGDRWRSLIVAVRQEFQGSLGYQANWDHREVPTFLADLDFLASNAYFELVEEGASPSIAKLEAAWQPFHRDLVSWAGKHGKPLLISEVGYPSLSGAAAHPWDYTRSAPVDLEEQRRAFEAFFRVWSDPRSAQGYFVYEWWGPGGPEDRGYTPRGKPAEQTLRTWLQRR